MSIRWLLAVPAALLGSVVAIPVLLLGLPFWLVGILTHRLALRLSRQVVRWPDIYQFDPALGWRAKPNLDCDCLEEKDDVFHIRTDEHGWPLGPSLAESQMVVIGDSHVFGYGVDHWASFFSRLNGQVRVKAIGVPGYHLVQGLLLMKRLSAQLRGKLVVWFVYIGNDLHEALQPEINGYRNPFVRNGNGDGNWEIVTSHLSPVKWTTSTSSRSPLYPILASLHDESHLAGRAYSACAFLLKEAARISCEAGFPLVVMTVPAPFALADPQDPTLSPYFRQYRARINPDYPDRRIALICERLGVPFVSLKKHLTRQDFKERDDHLTERGHERVAAVLADVYRTYHSAPAEFTPLHPVPHDVSAATYLG